MPAAGSQIDGQRAAAFFADAIFKVLQRAHVRIGQVVHMNVVANTGAIRRRVVGAVDPQRWSVRGGGGERQWNQMSFRIVELANFAAFVGPGGVEITETHRAQSVSAAVSLQRVFKKKFRCAVGIHRFARGPLGDRTLFGDAVHSAAGGEHEAANTGVQRGVQQGERAENVVPEIFARVLDRLANIGVGGKVHHRVHAREHWPEPGFVGDVALHKFEALRQSAKSGGEIVIEHDLIAGTPQRARRMTADVACSAGHQDCQGKTSNDCSMTSLPSLSDPLAGDDHQRTPGAFARAYTGSNRNRRSRTTNRGGGSPLRQAGAKRPFLRHEIRAG